MPTVQNTDTSRPTAGWYDDPLAESVVRWWDGRQWTTHVRPPVGLPEDHPVVVRQRRALRRRATRGQRTRRAGSRMTAVGVALAVLSVMPGLATGAWNMWAQHQADHQLAAAFDGGVVVGDEPRMLGPAAAVPDYPFTFVPPPPRTRADDPEPAPEPEPEPEPEPLVCSNGCAEQDPDGACVACHPASSEPSGTGQGEAIGRIVADSIDLDVALVYGTSDAALRSGPGWMEGSAWLGEPGNAVVSGHRTTYGSPFNRVDELEPGDRIEIRMPGSPDAVYEVRDLFITSPQEVGVTAGTRGARLTLTSCHPKGYAHERIIVQAELVDGPFVSEALEWGDWPPYPRRQPL